jgi:transcriptional antiterminator RfaH
VRFDDDLKPGQPIRLRTGPFAGAFGVLSRLDARRRVEVLMEILNGDIRLNLARDELEPLRDQSPA